MSMTKPEDFSPVSIFDVTKLQYCSFCFKCNNGSNIGTHRKNKSCIGCEFFVKINSQSYWPNMCQEKFQETKCLTYMYFQCHVGGCKFQSQRPSVMQYHLLRAHRDMLTNVSMGNIAYVCGEGSYVHPSSFVPNLKDHESDEPDELKVSEQSSTSSNFIITETTENSHDYHDNGDTSDDQSTEVVSPAADSIPPLVFDPFVSVKSEPECDSYPTDNSKHTADNPHSQKIENIADNPPTQKSEHTDENNLQPVPIPPNKKRKIGSRSGSRWYTCGRIECEFQCSTMLAMKHHYSSKHSITKLYFCESCCFVSPYHNSYRKHIIRFNCKTESSATSKETVLVQTLSNEPDSKPIKQENAVCCNGIKNELEPNSLMKANAVSTSSILSTTAIKPDTSTKPSFSATKPAYAATKPASLAITTVKKEKLKEEKTAKCNIIAVSDAHDKYFRSKLDAFFINCLLCQFRTKYLKSLTGHVKSYHITLIAVSTDSIPNTDLKFSCRYCSEEDDLTATQVASHYILKHMPQETMLSCEVCDVQCKDVEVLVRHLKTQRHIDEYRRSFRCDECGFGSCTRQNLQKHTKEEHGEDFNCEDCDFTTKYYHKLSRHRKTTHLPESMRNPETGMYCCDECSYSVSNKRELLHHISLGHDVNVQRYYCEQCPFVSSSTLGLRNHKITKHVKTIKSDVVNTKHKK